MAAATTISLARPICSVLGHRALVPGAALSRRRINKALRIAAAAMILHGVLGTNSSAMTFRSTLIGDTQIGLVAWGPIQAGDGQKLEDLLAKLPRHMPVIGISLDSPGGLVSQGLKLAQIIRTNQLPTYLDDGHHCFSACFLLFAAGKQKWAAASSYIGVHSAASITGQESIFTLGATGVMARMLSDLGVSDAIIGKMVTTKPGKLASLRAEDLAAMGVHPLVQSPFPPFNALVAIPDCVILSNKPTSPPIIVGLNTYPCRSNAFPGLTVEVIAHKLRAIMQVDMSILDFRAVAPEKLIPADSLREIRRHLKARRAYWIVASGNDPQEALVRGVAIEFDDWMIAEIPDNSAPQVLPRELTETNMPKMLLAAPNDGNKH